MTYKSRLAWEATCRAFVLDCQQQETGMYFWTFTTRKVHRLPEYKFMWNRFLRDIFNEWPYDLPRLGGIRTIQLQKRGALHWHCIINKRLPIDRLEEMGYKHGLGWMWVEKIESPKRAINYVARYIEEGIKTGFEGTRMKTWGTLGFAPWKTRVSQIKVRNECTAFIQRLRKEFFNDTTIPSWLAREVYQCWHIGYKVREDFICWSAKEAQAKGHDLKTWACWDTMRLPVWNIQRETDGVGEDCYDGRIPF